VFGHTHHRKKITLPNGTTYVNTGTWARLMRFPDDLISDDDAIAGKALESRSSPRSTSATYKTDFVPTYARLDLRDDDRVETIELLEFDGKTVE
jgi:hypothetical protein